MSAHIMEAIQFLLTFAEFFLCFLYLELFIDGSKIKKRNLYRVILPCVGLAVVVACNRNIFFFSFLALILQILLVCFIASIIYKMKGIWLFAFVYFYNIQVAVLDFALTFLFTKNRTDQEYVNEYLYHVTVTRLLVFFFCRLLLSIIYFILLNKTQRTETGTSIIPYAKILLIISVCETAATYYFMSLFTAFKNFTQISSWAGMLIIGIVACSLLAIYIRYCIERQRIQITEMRNAMLEKSYQDIYKASVESASEYHDFKNQLGMIYDYIQDGRNKEALSYIEKIRRPVLLLQEYTQTGNRAIDLVLSDKLKLAHENRVKVTTRLDKIGSIEVDDFDFYSIMANVLDNAIEACNLVTEGKRWIDIILTRRNQIVFIEIRNSLQISPVKGKILLRSIKEDDRLHGYGLQSVEMIVEKYNGYVEISYDEETFDISITIFADKI